VTLEEALREAATKGLTHVTIWPVESHDRKTVYWYARATPSTGHSYVQTHALDPAEAMVEVLKALPNAKKRHAPAKDPNLYGSGLVEVTAPVSLAENIRSLDAHRPPTTVADLDPTLANWLPKG